MSVNSLMGHADPSMESFDDRRSLSIVQAIEAAIEVRRRYQFFVWTQGRMQAFLPHKLAICGVYDRSQKQVRLEVFNSVVIPAPVLGILTDGQSPLMQHLVNAWINNRGRPLVFPLASLSSRLLAQSAEALMEAGFSELLIHAVSRPQRVNEIETMFVFGTPQASIDPSHVSGLELILPHLHSTYLRVQSIEREVGDALTARSQQSFSKRGYTGASVSEREAQVLSWVREGLSNQEIGAQLNISPLTVKNHIQKILRKLGATNRAQAVARAMGMNLLTRPRDERAEEAEP